MNPWILGAIIGVTVGVVWHVVERALDDVAWQKARREVVATSSAERALEMSIQAVETRATERLKALHNRGAEMTPECDAALLHTMDILESTRPSRAVLDVIEQIRAEVRERAEGSDHDAPEEGWDW